ncbi:MAG: M64 family metallopeptidase [Oligoflexia bacterium]|nr:M64 family metallopeptidase [Oligoflexia bacterium]
MQQLKILLSLLVLLIHSLAGANPYPYQDEVTKDPEWLKNWQPHQIFEKQILHSRLNVGQEVMRIQVDWSQTGEVYALNSVTKELSGTPGLKKTTSRRDALGSYIGIIRNSQTGEALGYSSVGTGQEYRKLVRAMTFRFPMPQSKVIFQLMAEDPQSGIMKLVLEKTVELPLIQTIVSIPVETRILSSAVNQNEKLIFAIYADGYLANRKNVFWLQAQKTVDALKRTNFPGIEHFEFVGVFAPSNQALGSATDFGLPVKTRDSFLGLYYPYWNKFGRWYHIVYPTNEKKFRDALGQVPHDYALALLDNSEYWGIGNYKAFTAIPAGNTQYFAYLLTHELGHFFGLNEEYDGGGATELEFATGIDEPWSQNITFLKDPKNLKWKQFVKPQTPIPTPLTHWSMTTRPLGAYVGGYADSLGNSHIPGMDCAMSKISDFCPVCKHAIVERVKFDLGH